MTQREQRVAIILAAGASSRAGVPKAMAKGPSGTMLQKTCEPFLKIGATPLVVTGFSAHAIEHLAEELALRFVRNPTPSDGMASSIRVGLGAVDRAVEFVFIHPVDCPGVAPETLETLLSSVRACREILAAKPMHRGRGGHPVLLRKEACSAFLDHATRPNLRQFLRWLGSKVLLVETEDRAVLRDLDTREDIETWVRESIRT